MNDHVLGLIFNASGLLISIALLTYTIATHRQLDEFELGEYPKSSMSMATPELTLYEEAQSRWPTATPDALDTLLWLTPYPCGTFEQITTSMDRMKVEFGDNINEVINGEMRKFDNACMRSRT